MKRFFGNSPTGPTGQLIFANNGSKDADLRKAVLFWVSLI